MQQQIDKADVLLNQEVSLELSWKQHPCPAMIKERKGHPKMHQKFGPAISCSTCIDRLQNNRSLMEACEGAAARLAQSSKDLHPDPSAPPSITKPQSLNTAAKPCIFGRGSSIVLGALSLRLKIQEFEGLSCCESLRLLQNLEFGLVRA